MYSISIIHVHLTVIAIWAKYGKSNWGGFFFIKLGIRSTRLN